MSGPGEQPGDRAVSAVVRRCPPRAARPSNFGEDADAEGLCAKDADCACAPMKNGGKMCVHPALCDHLRSGIACAHESPFERRLRALRACPLGAPTGIRFASSEVGDGGSGVLCFRDFQPGRPLLIYSGRVVRGSRPPSSNKYVMALPGSLADKRPRWLVGDPKTCLATRVNHSCFPNVDVVKLRSIGGPPEPEIIFYAKRRVRGGRRDPVVLTVSYDFADAEQRGERCLCGYKQCCGIFGCSPELCERRRAQAKRSAVSPAAVEEAALAAAAAPAAAVEAPAEAASGSRPVGGRQPKDRKRRRLGSAA